jgi:hypothetical protein
MFSRGRRTALLAGALVSALAIPAVAADADGVKEEVTLSDQPLVMAASTTTQVNVGPVIARESLAAGADEVAVVGGAEQTRSAAGLAAIKRLRAARAARAASYTGNGNGYRSTPLILGVRF